MSKGESNTLLISIYSEKVSTLSWAFGFAIRVFCVWRSPSSCIISTGRMLDFYDFGSLIWSALEFIDKPTSEEVVVLRSKYHTQDLQEFVCSKARKNSLVLLVYVH